MNGASDEAFYNRVIELIKEYLGFKYIMGVPIHEVIASGKYYYFPNEFFSLFLDANDDIPDEEEALISINYPGRLVGPDRTVEILYRIQKAQRYELIPAIIILCGNDLLSGEFDRFYENLCYYARKELTQAGYFPFFIQRARWYLGNGLYEYCTYIKEEYHDVESFNINLGELARKKNAERVAHYVTTYFTFMLGEKYKIVFYHKPFDDNYDFDTEWCRTIGKEIFKE